MHGTSVPVEEPSTASLADSRRCPNWDKLFGKLGQVEFPDTPLDPPPIPGRHAEWLAGVPVSHHVARF
jgi:hypothetical protein